MEKAHPKTLNIARSSQQLLEAFYLSNQICDVTNHIYIEDDMEEGKLAHTLIESTQESIFLGIKISKRLSFDLENSDSPFDALSNQNIRSFVILAEEISHFSYLCEAASSNSQTSIWELELQSEFDKMILSSLLLIKQTGHSHMRALARLIFDSSRIYNRNRRNLYETSENMAASWWWSHINRKGDALFFDKSFQSDLLSIRRLNGQKKLEFISNSKISTNKIA